MNTFEPYIGLDCLSLPPNFSGAGYYIYYLVRALLQSTRSYSFTIFCKPEHNNLFTPFLKQNDKIITIPLKNRLHRLYFYEFELKEVLIREKIKIFHATHYICPPSSAHYMIVTTFHDMGFYLFPHYYPLSKRIYFRKRFRTFLNRSHKIVAISGSTKDAIVKTFPEYLEKMVLIYPGADHLLNETIEAKSSFSINGPFILAVNSFEKRKNIPFIIKLFDYLKMKYGIEHKLIIIGHQANGYQQILAETKKSKFSEDIHLLLSVTTKELVYFYRKSDFFINASSYEGFGFSPLESINFKLPTFIYKNTVIAELLNDNPYVFKNLEIEKWAEYINEEIKNNFLNKILPVSIQHLSWENTKTQFIELFNQLISLEEPAVVS